MANKFEISIVALDKATAVVRRINDTIARVTKPLKDVGKAASALSKELGMEKIGRSLKAVGSAAADVGARMKSVVAPLAAIVGVGSVAAIADLATAWARLGSETARSASLIGIGAADLQGFQGAARAIGLSAMDATASLRSLGNVMEDAGAGRNQEALGLFNRLHIGLHRTAAGGIDTSRAMTDLSIALSRITNPQARDFIAKTFGVEGMLPLLAQGPKALKAYEDRVRQLGGVMSGDAVRSAQQFGLSLNYLGVAADGLKNTIGYKLTPILMPLIDQLTNWIAKNKDLIATDVAKIARGLADALKSIDWGAAIKGIKDTIDSVNKFVAAIGGWKGAIIGLVFLMNAGLIGSVVSLGANLIKFGMVAIPAAVGGIGNLSLAMAASKGGFLSILNIVSKLTWGLLRLWMAWKVGTAVGTWLNNTFFNGTKLGDAVGQMTNFAGALFGNQASADAIALNSGSDDVGKVPIGIRQNNPGNLVGFPGAASANGYNVFKTKLEGVTAIGETLHAYKALHGIHTIAGLVDRYANAKYKGNSPATAAGYISDLSKFMGVGAGDALDFDSPQVMDKMIRGIIRHENGLHNDPYPQQTINQAIEITLHGLPAGVRATAKQQSGAVVPVKVGHAMPTAVSP